MTLVECYAADHTQHMRFQKGDIIAPEFPTQLAHVLIVDRFDDHGCMWARPIGDCDTKFHFKSGEEKYFRLLFRTKRNDRKPKP